MNFDLDELLARNSQLRAPGETRPSKATRKNRGTSKDVPLNVPISEKARRSRAGTIAVARGAKWEDAVKKECERALRNDEAVVSKLEPPSRTVRGKGGALKIIFLSKGGPDWIGVAFGCPVAFETKAVHSVNRYSVLKKNENQIAYLRNFQANCDSVGKQCVVGYYIYWRESGERRFHPIKTISGRSISRTDGYLVQSWVDAAKEILHG